MEHCNQCGRDFESSSAGTYTDEYGFVCNDCKERMHFCPCTICGREFPIYEMVDWDGDLFCKNDYDSAQKREKKEEESSKEQEEVKELIEEKRSESGDEELDKAQEEIEEEMKSLRKKERKDKKGSKDESDGPED